MMIKVGDRLPQGNFMRLEKGALVSFSGTEIFAGRKVVLFGTPGAFTPKCTERHVPGFLQHAAAIHAKGVDHIVCMSVNDPFVMKAWGHDLKVGSNIVMLADSDASFTRSLGLEFDASAVGLGIRCRRFAIIARDGLINHLAIEDDPQNVGISGAEAILSEL